MKPTIDIEELVLSVDMVSSPMGEAEAFVNRRDGRIAWVGDMADEEPPDDLHDEQAWLAVPHKHELDLGRRLVDRFVRSQCPALGDEIDEVFRRRGGWRRFKDLLDHRGLLDAWHAFEDAETTAALEAWCRENGFEPAGRSAAGAGIPGKAGGFSR